MGSMVGVDPGGRWTGVVARDGNRLLYAATVTRSASMSEHIAEVDATIIRALAAVHRYQLLAGKTVERPVVAVEGLNPPTPHLGMTSVAGLIETAQVLGGVLHAQPRAVIVAPGGHGSAPLSCYPPALVGEREVVGTGKSRHMRSAWDVAGAHHRIVA